MVIYNLATPSMWCRGNLDQCAAEEQVLVVNKPGGSGLLAANAAFGAPPNVLRP
jgi:hypothetical protein